MGYAARLRVGSVGILARLCLPPLPQQGAIHNATTELAGRLAMCCISNTPKIRPILSRPISTNQPLTSA